MKKFILSAVMAIAALSSYAQQPVGGISLTPHIGFGYAIASEKILDTFSGYITGVAGVEATYKATDMFGLSLGFDYGYGSTVTESYNKSAYGIKTNGEAYFTHYMINIPVLAQLHFGQFAVKAGIQPGWTISPKFHAESSVSAEGTTINSKRDLDLDDDVNAFQLTVPVGISYTLNSLPLQFDLRYSIPVKSYDTDDTFKLGTIMLTAGYRFDLGK